MKKFLSLLICITAILAVITSFSVLASNDDVVSIEFCVGDDTLQINGDAVQVEKPYVVGDGVTLVPLRVITEAFGATVEWVDTTQSVYLTYPDVNIYLQINNPVAEVNQKAVTLLSSPELTESGYTMVPLRFISENFGATVSYDEITEKITVVKEKKNDSLKLVEGAVNSKMVGDSYYNWSIENSANLKMDTRSFDGTYTSFKYDDYNYFAISIDVIAKDYDFEREFMNVKAALQDYTLVKADKNADNNKKRTMHFQAKDKTEFVDIRTIVTDKYYITLFGTFENEKNEIKDECIRLMSTFDCTYNSADTYDLSNVVNGMRVYKAENLNLSFSVPQDYYMTTAEDSENIFRFARLDINDISTSMNVCVYSKQDVISAKELANEDYKDNKSFLNEDISEFCDEVYAKQYKNFIAYEYTYKLDGIIDKQIARDVFFELGDYVYNINITLKTPYIDADEFIDSIINSVEAKEIDFEKVGILMRNVMESTGTYKSEFNDCTLELPNVYKETVNVNNAVYLNMKNGIAISANVLSDGKFSFSDIKNYMEEIEESERKSTKATIISPTEVNVIGSNRFICLSVSREDDEGLTYIEQYATMKNSVPYVFIVAYPEVTYSKAGREEIRQIMSSFFAE